MNGSHWLLEAFAEVQMHSSAWDLLAGSACVCLLYEAKVSLNENVSSLFSTPLYIAMTLQLMISLLCDNCNFATATNHNVNKYL